MIVKELEFEILGCCNELRRAVVDVEDGAQAIVTDNGDSTFAVVRIKNGLAVPGSSKIIGPDDEI